MITDKEHLFNVSEAIACIALVSRCLNLGGGEYDKIQLSVLGRLLGEAYLTLSEFTVSDSIKSKVE